jgi:tRNA(adenine34) deaminase
MQNFMTDSSIHETFMREALKEANKAFVKGDVPVGAVVVFQNKIIARAHNQMELLHDPTAHAEMIAITQAADFLRQAGGEAHRGSLEKASIYVTLEPCPMCAGALVMAHCENLFYSAKDPKAGACGSLYNIVQDDRMNHRLNVQGGILEEDSRSLIQEFFKNLRREKR